MQKLRFLSLAVSMAMASLIDTKKVTKDFLESEIAETKYTRISPRTTHCLITTRSGCEFTGESTVADEGNFDEELGKQYAYQQAFESMYEPYGFLLRYITQNKAQSEDDDTQEVHQMTGDEKFGIELAVALAESGDTVYRKDGVTLTPNDVKAVDWQVV